MDILFFSFVTNLCTYIQNLDLLQTIKDDILVGRLSPFTAYDMCLEDDSVECIYCRCF